MTKSSPMWATRLGVGAATFLTALGFLAVPAHADTTPSVDVDITDSIPLAADGANGKVFPAFLSAENVTDLKVTIDLSDVSKSVSAFVLDPNLECTDANRKITCDLPVSALDLALPIVLFPESGAEAGDAGTLKVTLSADGVSDTAESKVKLADGVDLIALTNFLGEDPRDQKPGDTISLPVSVANVGNRTAKGFTFTFLVGPGLVPATYNNCKYVSFDSATLVTCRINGLELETGLEAVFDNFEATVAPDGLGLTTITYLAQANGESSPLPQTLLSASVARSGGKEFGVNGEPTPRRVSLQNKAATEIDLRDNFGGADYLVKNTFDLAAVGATASGAVNSTVTVKVGLKNNGPGSLDTSLFEGEAAAKFTFETPPGTEVVGVPAGCAGQTSEGKWEDGAKGKALYQCVTGARLAKGESYLVDFGLKILVATPNAMGSVAWDRGEQRDTNPDNDAANVVINPGTGNGGDLPVTGTQISVIAGAGGALLVAGVALFMVSRRRRVLLVTPKE